MPIKFQEQGKKSPAPLGVPLAAPIVQAANAALARQLVLVRESDNPRTYWSPEDCQQYIQAVRDHRSRLNRVGKALSSPAKTRYAVRHALAGYASRLTAVVRVASRANRLISFQEAKQLAAETKLNEPCTESVVAKELLRHGKTRTIFIPGHRRRVRQLLIRDALIAAGTSQYR